MSQKHFVALAAAIANIKDEEARWQAYNAVADVCHEFNPSFNRSTFRTACCLDVPEKVEP
jgi:hypothetical protein